MSWASLLLLPLLWGTQNLRGDASSSPAVAGGETGGGVGGGGAALVGRGGP